MPYSDYHYERPHLFEIDRPDLPAWRKAFGLSQPDAADLFGVDKRTWRRWEAAGWADERMHLLLSMLDTQSKVNNAKQLVGVPE